MKTPKIRTYSELIEIPDYMERYRYLRLGGKIGMETFGKNRYINQKFYRSAEWLNFRRQIILRDRGCDMADPGHEFVDGENIIVHHMNPIDEDDILCHSDYLMNPEYVISVSSRTHNAIHFGDESLLLPFEYTPRRPNDTCPWR